MLYVKTGEFSVISLEITAFVLGLISTDERF